MRLQSRLHPVVRMTDDEILKAFMMQVHDRTPHALIGEALTAPTARVQGGMLDRDPDPHMKVFSIPTPPAAIPKPEPQYISCISLPVRFEEFDGHTDLLNLGEGRRLAGERKLSINHDRDFYIHVYQAQMPFRELLTNHKPGDTVTVVNDNYEHQEHTLTEKDFEEMSYVVVRFAISKV